jgi:Skp family chaperone for outer membrane proteins
MENPMLIPRNFLITAAALTVLVIGLVGVNAQGVLSGEPTVVAVVDLGNLYESLKEKQQIDAELGDIRTRVTQESEDRKTDIAQKQQDLDMLVPGTPPYADAQESYERAALDYQVWVQYEQNKLAREANIRIKKLQENLKKAIDSVAETQSVGIVLYKQQSLRLGTNSQGRPQTANIDIVAWASDSVDITDLIAQQMNNDFDNN